jgi:hypothetical protein
MLREQTINFLEATVIFLLLTNALSILAATWAIHLASGVDAARRRFTRGSDGSSPRGALDPERKAELRRFVFRAS